MTTRRRQLPSKTMSGGVSRTAKPSMNHSGLSVCRHRWFPVPCAPSTTSTNGRGSGGAGVLPSSVTARGQGSHQEQRCLRNRPIGGHLEVERSNRHQDIHLASLAFGRYTSEGQEAISCL